MSSFIQSKHKGVSTVITTMLILVITVFGAVLVANAVHDGFFTGISQTPSLEAQTDALQLTAYDTRDSDDLTNLSLLDNYFNQTLCASSCSAFPNDIPGDGGTEFLILQIRNIDVNPVYLHNIMIKNEGHTWDTNTSNQVLDASNSANAGTGYPIAGKFSIIPASNDPPITQRTTIEVQGDEEVRLVIKLSENLQDIEMWDSLRILVNFGGPQPAEFIILSGDAKW